MQNFFAREHASRRGRATLLLTSNGSPRGIVDEKFADDSHLCCIENSISWHGTTSRTRCGGDGVSTGNSSGFCSVRPTKKNIAAKQTRHVTSVTRKRKNTVVSRQFPLDDNTAEDILAPGVLLVAHFDDVPIIRMTRAFNSLVCECTKKNTSLPGCPRLVREVAWHLDKGASSWRHIVGDGDKNIAQSLFADAVKSGVVVECSIFWWHITLVAKDNFSDVGAVVVSLSAKSLE